MTRIWLPESRWRSIPQFLKMRKNVDIKLPEKGEIRFSKYQKVSDIQILLTIRLWEVKLFSSVAR